MESRELGCGPRTASSEGAGAIASCCSGPCAYRLLRLGVVGLVGLETSHLPEAGSVSDPGLFTPPSTTPFGITSPLLARQLLRQIPTHSDILIRPFLRVFSPTVPSAHPI